jgi:hypothetical protein
MAAIAPILTPRSLPLVLPHLVLQKHWFRICHKAGLVTKRRNGKLTSYTSLRILVLSVDIGYPQGAGLIYWKKNNTETQLLRLTSIDIRSRLNDIKGLKLFFSGGWIGPAHKGHPYRLIV